MTESRTRLRMKVLAALVVCMFAALTTRLWFLQVLAAPQFKAQADQNQVRLIPIEPVRGQILDRSGHVLVGNRSTVAVTIDRQNTGFQAHEDAVLFRLSQILNVPVATLLSRVNSLQYLPYQPVPVAEDVPKQTVFYIREHADEYPGVGYQLLPVREYPDGSMAAQVLGTLGESLPGQMKGTGGVEQVYNKWLAGSPGKRAIQVDAQGNVLNSNFGSIPATSGDNLVLSIDARIQALADGALRQGIMTARATVDPTTGNHYPATGGAVIVMNPNNGQVLAMSSYPSYDPSLFVKGFSSQAEFHKLFLSQQSGYPLVNRAIQGQYPPGSTFKPFVAAAALHEGTTTENRLLDCPGQWSVPGDTSGIVFHNWDPANLGPISLPAALTMSCDTFFYQLGYFSWQKYVHSGYNPNTGTGGTQFMQRDLMQQGFAHPTGVDLPSEQQGIIPTTQYKKNLYRSDPSVYGKYWQWQPGDNVNMSIGQGFVQVTPLQLADAYSAIANGGTVWQPHVAWRIQAPDGKVVKTIEPHRNGRLPISRQEATFLRNSLTGVTANPSGTAYGDFLGFPLSQIPVAGKTGTADINPNNPAQEPDSWFAAIAPANHPKYVVVCIVEAAGHGGTTAAPIVRQVLDGLFGLNSIRVHLGQDRST